MRLDIITLFPGMFAGPLTESIIARAQKRGGGIASVSIDAQDAEGRYRLEPADPMTPEKLYERRWALTVLDQALGRLQAEYAASGRRAALRARHQAAARRGIDLGEQGHGFAAEVFAAHGAVQHALVKGLRTAEIGARNLEPVDGLAG